LARKILPIHQRRSHKRFARVMTQRNGALSLGQWLRSVQNVAMVFSHPVGFAPGDQFMPKIPPPTSKLRLPICRICWGPVELGTDKTDENGQANHEECNDRQLNAQKRTSSPKT
jgi:hypothetical protein